jgi:hypothetical protein
LRNHLDNSLTRFPREAWNPSIGQQISWITSQPTLLLRSCEETF